MVTEEQSKLLSQPRTDAQGKPIAPVRGAPAPKGTGPKSAAAAASPPAPAADPPPPEAKPAEDASKRKVRAVGPTFLPAR